MPPQLFSQKRGKERLQTQKRSRTHDHRHRYWGDVVIMSKI